MNSNSHSSQSDLFGNDVIQTRNKYLNLNKFQEQPIYIDLKHIRFTRPPSPETIFKVKQKYTKFKCFRQSGLNSDDCNLKNKKYLRRRFKIKLKSSSKKHVKQKHNENTQKQQSSLPKDLTDRDKPQVNISGVTMSKEINTEKITPPKMKRKRKSKSPTCDADYNSPEGMKKKSRNAKSPKIVANGKDSRNDDNQSKEKSPGVQNVFQVMMDKRTNGHTGIKSPKNESPLKKKSKDLNNSQSEKSVSRESTPKSNKKIEKDDDKSNDSSKSPLQKNKMFNYIIKKNKTDEDQNSTFTEQINATEPLLIAKDSGDTEKNEKKGKKIKRSKKKDLEDAFEKCLENIEELNEKPSNNTPKILKRELRKRKTEKTDTTAEQVETITESADTKNKILQNFAAESNSNSNKNTIVTKLNSDSLQDNFKSIKNKERNDNKNGNSINVNLKQESLKVEVESIGSIKSNIENIYETNKANKKKNKRMCLIKQDEETGKSESEEYGNESFILDCEENEELDTEKPAKKKVRFSEFVSEKEITPVKAEENSNAFYFLMKSQENMQNEANLTKKSLKKATKKLLQKETLDVSDITVINEIETKQEAIEISNDNDKSQKDLLAYFGLANASNVEIAKEKAARTRREAKEKRDLLELIKTIEDVDISKILEENDAKKKIIKKKNKDDKRRASLEIKDIEDAKDNSIKNKLNCSNEDFEQIFSKNMKTDNDNVKNTEVMDKTEKKISDECVLQENKKVRKKDNKKDENGELKEDNISEKPAEIFNTARKHKKKHKERKKSKDEIKPAETLENMTHRTRWKMKLRLALGDDTEKERVVEESNYSNEELEIVSENEEKDTIKKKLVMLKKKTDSEKEKKSVKLAPLFIKSKKKPKRLSAKEIEAKKNFLHSGMPDSVKKKIEKETKLKEYEYSIFPLISHVQQKSSVNNGIMKFWNLKEANLNLLPPLKNTMYMDKMLMGNLSDIYKIPSCINNTFTYSLPKCIHNYKAKLNELKQANPKYPIYKYFRLLSEQTKSFNVVIKKETLDINTNSDKTKTPESIKKKKKGRPKKRVETSDESVEIIEVADSNLTLPQNQQRNILNNLMWTEKYKPSKVEAILGNKASISELSDWLKYWLKNSEDATKSTVRKRRRYDDSENSDSDFDSNSRDSSRSQMSKDNTVILTGPNGSGKTSTLYVLCNELGINVLELNASSRRTGKKLMQELQEATQSHQVHKTETTMLQNFMQKDCEENSASSVEKSDRKMCLLLVEDIDVVFDQDDGFISALTTLLNNSKRPIVLTTSNSSCPHVEKFTNQHSVIKFRKPSPSFLAVWFQVLCLVEGLNVDKETLIELIEFNSGDIRKSLLQLEFWVRSGGDPQTTDSRYDVNLSQLSQTAIQNPWFSEPLFDIDYVEEDDASNLDWMIVQPEMNIQDENSVRLHNTCSMNLVTCSGRNNIPYPIDLSLYWWNFSNLLHREKTEGITANDLCRHSNLLDSLGLVDAVYTKLNLDSGFEPTPGIWQSRLRDSLELKEIERNFDSSVDIAHEWGHFLLDSHVNLQESNRKFYLGELTYLGKKSRMKHQSVSDNLTNAVPIHNILSRKAIATEYLPTLRTIHRTEEKRSEYSTKRGNRFYHYLRSFNITINDETSEIIKKTLKM